MRLRFPKVLCCLLLLLITLAALPSCSREEPDNPAVTTEDPGSVSAKGDDLIGSWMRLSGDGMAIYTFRPNGEITIYEMESATVVRERLSGSYTLTGDRLELEIGGRSERYSVLTEGGRALILDGEILTPAAEPEN